MAQIHNHFWVDAENRRRMINPSTFKGKYCLSGIVTDREGFRDGTLIKTSPIVSLKDNIAITASGSEYELGEISPDYICYLEALEMGTPIICKWDFFVQDGDPKDCFYGYTSDGNLVKGEIVEQFANYITIKNGSTYSPDGCLQRFDRVTFFVIWSTWNSMELPFFKSNTGLKYPDDFENFAGYICKPQFFAN